MKTLTVFTPTFNRNHTLLRTYESLYRQTCRDFDWLIIDDGSTDGTREWIESLGPKMISSGQKFDWMGRIEEGEDENHFVIQTSSVRIEYVYKPNGGLYTGYNVAYQSIQTELCVCIDSDDYMPDDAVEKILTLWKDKGGEKYCGIIGLDLNIATQKPIGGCFPEIISAYYSDLAHKGDTKQIYKTSLMRQVAPMFGFKGERDFNPHYMQMQVMDKLPLLVLNNILCNVEYQIGVDSMSQGIFKQYVRSPRSYALYRLMEMSLSHGLTKRRLLELNIHYVSSCILSNDKLWLKNSPKKFLTMAVAPIGILLTLYILYKTRK